MVLQLGWGWAQRCLGLGWGLWGPPHPNRALPHGRAVTCGSPWGQVQVG